MHDTESLQRLIPANAVEIANVIAQFNVEINKFILSVSKKNWKTIGSGLVFSRSLRPSVLA